MPSAKGKIVRWLGSSVLRRASVAAIEDVGSFRRLSLRGSWPKPGAGSKWQLLLPSDDMRTYSPIATPDGVMLLGWKRAGGPGARWFEELQLGAEVPFAGPQRSLTLPAGPVVIVGDETSVAVAASFEAERPGQVQAVFQAADVEELRAAAACVGVVQPVVVPSGDDVASLVDAIVAAQLDTPSASVGVTGGSRLVLAVRDALRARAVKGVKTKTYWVPGRCGLD